MLPLEAGGAGIPLVCWLPEVLTPLDETSLVIEGPEIAVLVLEVDVVPWRLVELLEDVVVDEAEVVVLVIDDEGSIELLTRVSCGVKL